MNIMDTFSGVSVDDAAKAKEYYSNILGFELADETMGMHFKLPGGGKLFVYEKPDHQAATYTALNLVVENIDQAVDELSQKGVKFDHYDNMPVQQEENGVMRGQPGMGPSIAWFKDPAGNVLALIEGDK